MNRSETSIVNMPRVKLIDGPTPIERLCRIEEVLQGTLKGVRLFVKRDDLMGLGGGGSKLRKLEYLIGAARADEADTIITVGGRQSNHARLTAAAAAKVGLDCELMLTQRVPRYDADYQTGGNVLLDRLFGAKIHTLPASTDALIHANARAMMLRSAGRKVYVIPSGGSSPTGCLGYVACAREIIEQSRSLGIRFDHIIVPNGSSGTHAGLAAGLIVLGEAPCRITSFSVMASEHQSRTTTIAMIRATLALVDERVLLDEAEVNVIGSERGLDYGAPTMSMMQALHLMGTREGLLLDPVYSGKAFAGLLAGINNGEYGPGENILFIMTGGAPGLFAYREEFGRYGG